MKQRGIRIIASGNLAQIPLSITAEQEGNVAIIRINGAIYNWRETSSKRIEEKIKAFSDKKITTAKIILNTPGGDVFEAQEIINIIDDSFETVTVVCGAIVASAGTMFLAKWHAEGRPNTQYMIHKPRGGMSGNEVEIKARLKLLKNITASYKAAYAKKMGITEDEVEALWENGDYWMNAKEAYKKKLINAVLASPAAIDASTRMMIAACGAPTVPKQESKQEIDNQNNSQMEKIIRAQLGLPEDATDAQVQAAIKALQDDAAEAKTLKEAATAKEKTEKSDKIKALLDGAEKEKKIDATSRPQYEKLADADFESTKTIIEGLTAVTAPPSADIQAGGGDADRSKWTYEDYQKEDPKAFEALSEEAQNKLIEANYKE